MPRQKKELPRVVDPMEQLGASIRSVRSTPEAPVLAFTRPAPKPPIERRSAELRQLERSSAAADDLCVAATQIAKKAVQLQLASPKLAAIVEELIR
jgi:hypothetical protein